MGKNTKTFIDVISIIRNKSFLKKKLTQLKNE